MGDSLELKRGQGDAISHRFPRLTQPDTFAQQKHAHIRRFHRKRGQTIDKRKLKWHNATRVAISSNTETSIRIGNQGNRGLFMGAISLAAVGYISSFQSF